MGLVRKIPKEALHVSKPTWWLESRFHFSFADYYNPENMSFGPLRVLNDDLVKANSGFGRHPHRDAEIFSYVVDGELTHQDSMGNKESLGRGSVQYLSAGTGITHSEMNDGGVTTRFLQIWLSPDRRGHTPQYGSRTFEPSERRNQLLLVLAGSGDMPSWNTVRTCDNPIRLHQDANALASESDPGVSHTITLNPNRQAYLVCIEGALDVNGTSLHTRDAVEIVAPKDDPFDVKMTAGDSGAHFLLLEMTQTQVA